jgi:hypothetical protein
MNRCQRWLLTGASLWLGVSAMAAEPVRLAHMVYFTLAEDTAENRRQLIAGCQQYLSGHDGTVYFSVGAIAADLDRDVNDQQFDVALHIVFADRGAHDRYQTDRRHLQFIDQYQSLWSKVRVFDSNLATTAGPIDRFLAAKVAFDAAPRSFADAVAAMADRYNQQNEGGAPVSIRLLTDDLKSEGITANQRLRGIDPTGKTVAELLTAIVVSANPDQRSEGTHDIRQRLIWAVSPDGDSIWITTRGGAAAAKLVLPDVFQPAKR